MRNLRFSIVVSFIYLSLAASCTRSPQLPQIIGLEDVRVKRLCFDVTFPRDTHLSGSENWAAELLADVFEAMGFQTGDSGSPCDARMIIELEGEASVYHYELFVPEGAEDSEYVRAVYELSDDVLTPGINCYSGVTVSGTWTVIASDSDQAVFPIAMSIDPPERIYIDDCEGSEGSPDSILRGASMKAVFLGIAEVWGDSTLMLALRNPNKATFFDHGVYGLAQYALEHGAPDSIPVLIQGLEDESPSVKKGAAEVLGRIGPMAKDAIPALTQLCEHDRDAGTSTAACLALEKIQE